MRNPSQILSSIFRIAASATIFICACGSAGGVGTCRSTRECARGQDCAGPNEPPGCGMPPRQGCGFDSDCLGGSLCHAIPDSCSASLVGSECKPPCSGLQCGPGFRCATTGACEPLPCDEGFACPTHQRCDPVITQGSAPIYVRAHGCVDIPCTDDSACPVGKSCTNGRCQDGPGSCVKPVAVP